MHGVYLTIRIMSNRNIKDKSIFLSSAAVRYPNIHIHSSEWAIRRTAEKCHKQYMAYKKNLFFPRKTISYHAERVSQLTSWSSTTYNSKVMFRHATRQLHEKSLGASECKPVTPRQEDHWPIQFLVPGRYFFPRISYKSYYAEYYLVLSTVLRGGHRIKHLFSPIMIILASFVTPP